MVRFGTSGLRGPAVELEQGPARDHAAAFARHLVDLGRARPGAPLYIGRDLRDSSEEIVGQVAVGVAAAGLVPVSLGVLPTPALALHAMGAEAAAIMVTGSHIPADQNGLKFYRPDGEIDKQDEAAIGRLALRTTPAANAPAMADEGDQARLAYRQRYSRLFPDRPLSGMRVGVYEHSSVAREILKDLLRDLGATVMPLGRSDEFIAIDTEGVAPAVREQLRDWAKTHTLDTIVSTDGDADRPLVVDESGEQVRGDALGLICARYVGAQTVATPVTSNTGISAAAGFEVVRTRVGSPYVIAAMGEAVFAGKPAVVGFEANGGFLTASALSMNGAALDPLPTRDCVLPILACLAAARENGAALSDLVASLHLPRTASDRLEHFAYEDSAAFMQWLRADPEHVAAVAARFGRLTGSADIDGVQMFFADGSALHFRPSGNAPEMRCYAEAAGAEQAGEMVASGLDVVRAFRAGSFPRN